MMRGGNAGPPLEIPIDRRSPPRAGLVTLPRILDTFMFAHPLPPRSTPDRVSEGRAFAIHDPDLFMNDIAPQFFDKQTHLRSFHRQLSIWVSSLGSQNLSPVNTVS